MVGTNIYKHFSLVPRLSPHGYKKLLGKLGGAWEGYEYQVSFDGLSGALYLPHRLDKWLLLVRTQTVLLLTQAHPTKHLPTRSLVVF